MNRTGLHALSVATVLTCPAIAFGQSAPTSSVTIYGVADVGVELSSQGRGSLTRVVSGGVQGSRLGLRGAEDLGSGLRAIFVLEQGFVMDSGNLAQGGRAFGREASVGISDSRRGSLIVGRLPTPYGIVSQRIDAFGWAGSAASTGVVRGATGVLVNPLTVTYRADNAMRYDSPMFGGVQLRALVGAGEGSTTTARTYSLSGRYADGPLEAIVGWQRQYGANNLSSTGAISGLSVGGSYNFGLAQVFVGYNDEKNSCTTCTGGLTRGPGVRSSEVRVINIGARVPFGAFTAIGQVARLQDRSVYLVDPGDRDATYIGAGLQYTLSQRTLLLASFGTVNNRNGSQYALSTGTVAPVPGNVGPNDPRTKVASFVFRHSF